MLRIRLMVLLVATGYFVAASAAAAAQHAPCSVGKWTSQEKPTGNRFGPDQNQPLNLQRAATLRIRAGHKAYFLFWAHRPNTENAFLIYSSDFNEVAKRKAAGGANWEPLVLSAPAHRDRLLILGGWHKPDVNGGWGPNLTRAEAYPPVRNMWIFGSEDGDASGDYRDFVAQVVCR